MAHPDTEVSEAVDVRPADDDAAAVDAFDRILTGEEEEGEDPEVEETEEEADEAEPEDTDEVEEQEEPAIPAPVSFNAEEKAVFATMTTEQQRAVAAIENRRNAQVQQATTRAAEAERQATANAQAQLAQIQREYAAGLEQYQAMFQVEEPDVSLIVSNPHEYQRQLAIYKATTAQYQYLEQQKSQALQQAQAYEREQEERFEAEQRSILARELPEWNDPEQRQKIATSIIEVGQELGYSPEELKDVTARDILALNRFAKDREKAAKYDALMSQKMEAVRAAKGKPAPVQMKPGTAQPKGSGQRRAYGEAITRLKSSGSDADAMAAFEAMGL